MSHKVCFREICLWLFLFACFLYGKNVRGNIIDYNTPQRADPCGIPYKEGELLVRFSPKAGGVQRTIAERNAILAGLGGGEVKYTFKLVPGLSVVKLPEGVKVEEVLGTFNITDGILYAHPSYIKKILSTFPNDPNFAQLWGLHNTGQLHPHDPFDGGGFVTGTPDADIDAPEAWVRHTNAEDIIVAVIDTGVDYNHPDLTENMWVNQEEADGNTGIDDDGNGYIDDIYGYDFCKWDKPRDSDPMDDMFHGTHVAGIIGAVGNNAQGVTGVCWNVKIMSLKFLQWWYHPVWGWGGYGSTDDSLACIDYAVNMGAKIINASYGGGEFTQAEKNMIEAANAAGVLFVASAGNYSYNNDYGEYANYPSSYDCNNIIAVMATDANDERPLWSNWGPTSVDLAAPGVDIFSTFPSFQTDALTLWDLSTNYETISGTSMSAPYVAGACALLWSYKPYLTHNQVKEGILETVDVIPSLDNDPDYGRLCLTGGRLNLYNAILWKPRRFIIEKTDDIPEGNCVLPDDTIHYTISYDSNGHSDTNVIIVDYLSESVEYFGSTYPSYYDEIERSVTWNIGTISIGDSNSLILRVRANELAEPLGTIPNLCMIEGDHSRTYAIVDTNVCAWNPGVVYVDANAVTGWNTGMQWKDAYLDLQDALARARMGCASEIWVAGGIYNPTTYQPTEDANFTIVDGVSMYGGFAGYETAVSQRDLANPDNKSILTGDIIGTEYVVRARNLEIQTVLDGFEIGYNAYTCLGVENSSMIVKNCSFSDGITGMDLTDCTVNVIKCSIDGLSTGVNSLYSNLSINSCKISNNGCGIYIKDSAFDINDCNISGNVKGIRVNHSGGMIPNSRIDNCIIYNNKYEGIYFPQVSSPIEISNNLIYSNEYGIIFYSYSPDLITVRNSTICKNRWGITADSSTIIRSCIFLVQ